MTRVKKSTLRNQDAKSRCYQSNFNIYQITLLCQAFKTFKPKIFVRGYLDGNLAAYYPNCVFYTAFCFPKLRSLHMNSLSRKMAIPHRNPDEQGTEEDGDTDPRRTRKDTSPSRLTRQCCTNRMPCSVSTSRSPSWMGSFLQRSKAWRS